MPRAQTRRSRGEQVVRWLHKEFPPPFPVKIRWVKHIPYDKGDFTTAYTRRVGILADIEKVRNRFIIRISLAANTTIAETVLTVIHEWAHVLTQQFAKQEEARASAHDDEYWLAYGRIDRAYHEYDGDRLSGKF